MTKKGMSSEIFAYENRTFFGKGKIVEIFLGVHENFSETGGKSETGGTASLPEGDGRMDALSMSKLSCSTGVKWLNILG